MTKRLPLAELQHKFSEAARLKPDTKDPVKGCPLRNRSAPERETKKEKVNRNTTNYANN